MGSQFHHGYDSRGPPIILDGRVSQVQFETLAFFREPSQVRERLKRWFAYAPALPGLPAASSLGQPERCAGFIKPATHPDVETAKCPESLRPILVLPPLERRVPPLPRALPLRHRYYQLVRQTHLAFLSFDFWSRLRKLCRLLPAPAASGSFPTLSLKIFPVMPGPLSRRLADCSYLVLPLPQRPSPREHGSAYRNIPLKRLHKRGGVFEIAAISLCSSLTICSPP
jgi:hypothetical protein